jgi:carboxypeptidase C (cathepsin A)
MIPYYEQFMDDTDYKIQVYSGDADTVINFISTETWILGLKRPVKKHWAPWTYSRVDGTTQVAGWGVDFDRIAYRTVKGAGHMVPWFQPAPALQMLKEYLSRN